MKVVLSTAGRFHMFALARELERHGVLERIYSGFPWASLVREHVSHQKVKTFPWVRPFLMGGRLGIHPPHRVMEGIHHLSLTSLDAYVRTTLPDCDIFVGHEGAGLWSGATAQRRGAVYICDRGCSHIGWQQPLLEAECDRVGTRWSGKPRTLDRELAEYERADLIVVPSTFAKASFVQSGVSHTKVVVVPYGVNLDTFCPIAREARNFFEVLYVGGLSWRKGAYDLVEAFEALEHPNKRLTIVGNISGDIKSALSVKLSAPNIRVMGSVPQNRLKQFFGNSDVLVLPSIDEGFGLVLAEALACGCPIIATTNTGAPDLITNGVEGFIVPIRSPGIITERLQMLAEDPGLQSSMSVASLNKAKFIGGWRKYGDSMLSIYKSVC